MPKISGIDRVRPEHTQNFIMNGNMEIAQRGTTFGSIANSTYNLDRWVYSKTGAMVHDLTQNTSSVPTLAESGQLYTKSLLLALTTPDTSIATGDVCSFEQRIEGYNWARIAQKPFTLSFWVQATLAGTYCVSFRNSGNDRSYVAEYTINSTNTWEKKTITVTASPSGGTWDYTSGIGLRVCFTLAAGSSLQTTAGAWQTGIYFATANQVNGVNTGATNFRITGVMLNEGLAAAPFALFADTIDGEVEACQRYFEKSANLTNVPSTAADVPVYFPNTNYATSSAIHGPFSFRTRKRTSPTITWYDSNSNSGRVSTIATGGAATNNVTPADTIAKEMHCGFQFGAVGSHAGFYAGFTADSEL